MPWHPFAAAAVLALGTGYRADIGLFWLPLFMVILWQHLWKRAMLAVVGYLLMILAWAGPMLAEAGGWKGYNNTTADFAYNAGVLNSFWNLGLIDGPVRYSVKLAMALLWTLGPALFFLPRGIARLGRDPNGGFLALMVCLSIAPALGIHLLLHFGVPGYCFHYLPALIALIVLGIGRDRSGVPVPCLACGERTVRRLIGMATILAATFWFYPTDFAAPGWRGDFDMSFCRLTRNGLNEPLLRPAPYLWRTVNSSRPMEPAAPGVAGADDRR